MLNDIIISTTIPILLRRILRKVLKDIFKLFTKIIIDNKRIFNFYNIY